MKLSIISLTFLAIATSISASPSPVATRSPVQIQARQNAGDSIRDSISSKVASRRSSISSDAQDRSSSRSDAALSRSSFLDSASVSRSSSIASVTLNHPTIAFTSSTNNCNGVNFSIDGKAICCEGQYINDNCYDLSSTIDGGTETPTATSTSDSNGSSNSNSNSNSTNSGHDDNGSISMVAQPAALLLGLIGGASFLLL